MISNKINNSFCTKKTYLDDQHLPNSFSTRSPEDRQQFLSLDLPMTSLGWFHKCTGLRSEVEQHRTGSSPSKQESWRHGWPGLQQAEPKLVLPKQNDVKY